LRKIRSDPNEVNTEPDTLDDGYEQKKLVKKNKVSKFALLLQSNFYLRQWRSDNTNSITL